MANLPSFRLSRSISRSEPTVNGARPVPSAAENNLMGLGRARGTAVPRIRSEDVVHAHEGEIRRAVWTRRHIVTIAISVAIGAGIAGTAGVTGSIPGLVGSNIVVESDPS